MIKRGIIFGFLVLVIWGCKTDKTKHQKHQKKIIPIKIISPSNDTEFVVGDQLLIELSVDTTLKASDIKLYFEDTLYKENIPFTSQTIAVDTKKGKVGWVNFYLSYKDSKGNPHRDNRRLIFFSDLVPEQKTAKIINTYPHQNTSYTQGLEFYNGRLFESTGQKGRSMIAEVDLMTGEIKRKKELDPQYFGEGITILNDTIYQLTWQSETCFLYDMDFNPIGQFSYKGEGWGLTNNGSSIIMTNGTSEVVWRNPHNFEIEKSLYVFKNDSDIPALNEIELIDDKLYANVYTDNDIVEIDTITGKVLSFIDCSNVENEGRNMGDVLNGIAYNPLTQSTYITGKLWNKLFEVKFE